MTFVEQNDKQLAIKTSTLLVDEDDLSSLVSQTFEYSEESEESPYFISSSYTE